MLISLNVCPHKTVLSYLGLVLQGPSMLPDKAKFMECAIITPLALLMKHIVTIPIQYYGNSPSNSVD